MNTCMSCRVELLAGAKFCHRCGDAVSEQTKPCPVCQQQSKVGSVFCHHCGFRFEDARERTYIPRFVLDFDQPNLLEQVNALFFGCLRLRVEEEHDILKYSDFVERFYDSRFRDIYESRARQIALEATRIWHRFGSEGTQELDRHLIRSFEGLLDYFIIQFCPDLHGFVLPETILKHEQALPGRTDMWQMIRDYLDFDRESVTLYADFITMPQHYLANACKEFLRAKRTEKVFFICDLSIKGNCKDGIALTNEGIYWKMPFERPQAISFAGIQTLKREKDWVLVNGKFFSISHRMNLKMYKLLKKLKGWNQNAS
jgi:Double zinc ribbon